LGLQYSCGIAGFFLTEHTCIKVKEMYTDPYKYKYIVYGYRGQLSHPTLKKGPQEKQKLQTGP
jgi:hypothetical protein